MDAQAISVLITGANRGLGLEMVKQMVECQIPVKKLIASCRDPDGPRAEDLRTLAKEHPNVIAIIRLDTSDLSSIKQCAQQVYSLVGTGGLNLLINNAGIVITKPLLETSPEDIQACFNTNLMGPMNIIKEFLPHLRAAAKASKMPGMSCRKAAVVCLTSCLGSIQDVHETYPYFSAFSYRISKVSLNMMTACAAEELKNDEILFSSLHPGWVRTEMGGENGLIDAPESVQGMLQVIASLTEKQNGSFLDNEGQTLSW